MTQVNVALRELLEKHVLKVLLVHQDLGVTLESVVLKVMPDLKELTGSKVCKDLQGLKVNEVKTVNLDLKVKMVKEGNQDLRVKMDVTE